MGRRNAIASVSNSVQTPLNISGCVAYWPFNETGHADTAKDVVGGYDLTPINNPAATTGRTSNRGARLLFAGGNGTQAAFQRSGSATTPALIATGQSFSFSFWINYQPTLNASGTSSTAFFVNFTNTVDTVNGQIRLGSGNPAGGWNAINTRLTYTDGTFTPVYVAPGNNPAITLPSVLPANAWCHFVWLYDASLHEVRIYKNGSLINTVAAAAGKTVGGIGGGLRTALANWNVPGAVADWALFNRVLTTSEIMTLATTTQKVSGLPAPVSSPLDIPNCAMWLDASDASTLYTTSENAVTAVSSPLDLSGCAMWLDASDTSTLFQDSAGTTPATADGASVGRWVDKSGQGNHATQTTAGNRPLLRVAGVNGVQALYFDIASVSFMTATRPAATQHTLLGVVRPTITVANGASPFAINDDASLHPLYSDGGMVWYSRSDGLYITSTVQIGLNPTIIGWTNNNLALSLTKDGTVVVSGTAGQNVNINSGLRIGRRRLDVVGGSCYTGYICELVYFNRVLSSSERARIEKYLALKWGIPGVHDLCGNGSPIGYWQDKSGNGRHAVQVNFDNRPKVLRPAINGLSAARFNGSTSVLTGNSAALSVLRNASAFSIVGVFTSEASTSARTLFYSSDSTNLGRIRGGIQWTSAQPQIIAARSDGDASTTLSGAANSVTNNKPHIVTATVDYNNTTARLFQNNITQGFNTAFATAGNTSDTDALTVLIGAYTGPAYLLQGNIGELIVYRAALTDQQRAQIECYLQNKWGIGVLPPTSGHAEVQDWITRVYQNGGTVSQYTANQVTNFCYQIDAAGLRDRMYRLNLFCGNDLAACTTPLYRGPVPLGSFFGNRTDTSTGFVVSDYFETGASGGLTGGTGRYLDTGLVVNNTDILSFGHLSAYGYWTAPAASGSNAIVEGWSDTNYRINLRYTTGSVSTTYGSSPSLTAQVIFSGGGTIPPGHWVSSRTSSTLLRLYVNGARGVEYTAEVTAAAVSGPNTAGICVFGSRQGGGPAAGFSGRLSSYSIGRSLTAQQVAAFYSIMQVFQTALSRNV